MALTRPSLDLPFFLPFRPLAPTVWLLFVGAMAQITGCADSSSPEPAPPLVVDTDPAPGATDVSVVPTIALVFDQPMTTTVGTVTVTAASVEQTIEELAWRDDDSRLEVTLVENLPEESPVQVRLETDFQSRAGLALEQPFRLSFRTGLDEDPPGVRTSAPMEGQVDVDVDRLEEVRVTFDEDMDTTIIQGRFLFEGGPETVFGSWDDDGRTIRFPVEVPLPKRSPIGLDLSVLADTAGNNPGPGASGDDAVLDFVSGPDQFAPTVQSTTPLEGATGVRLDLDEIVVVFSEAMDTSTTGMTLVPGEDDDFADEVPLTGVWESDNLVLVLSVPSAALRGQTAYSLDLRALTDAAGNPVEEEEPFTGDGVLDFETREATGESCLDALGRENATEMDGALVFSIPQTSPGDDEGILIADGGAASCNTSEPVPDAVIRIRKTTPSLSDGGSLLRVSARAGGPTGGFATRALEVVERACAPAAERFAERQLFCQSGRRRWDAHLDVGPGTYFIFVSGTSPGIGFPATDVVVDEIDDASEIEGETCAAPYTVESTIHQEPTSGVDRWVIPGDEVHGFDMDRSWGGDGVLQCIDDFRWGDRPGVDAVIEVDKERADSLLRVDVSGGFGTAWGVFSGSCDDLETRAPAGCVNAGTAFTSRFDGAVGISGTLYIWVAGAAPGTLLSTATTVEVEEIAPLAPGTACGRGIVLSAGENPVSSDGTERFGAPSCFFGTSNVLWYEWTLTEEAVSIEGTGDGGLALVDPNGAKELGCVRGASPTLGHISEPGETLCVAVETGTASSIAGLAVTPVDYTGPGTGSRRSVPFPAPESVSGPVLFEEWLTTDGEHAWISAAASPAPQLLEVDLEIGGAVERGDADGIVSDTFENDGIVVDGELFTVGDVFGSDVARLQRAWDGEASPWSPIFWDTSPDYPTAQVVDVAHDGEDFFLLFFRTPLRISRVPGGGGPPVEVTATENGLAAANQFAVSDSHVFLGRFSGTLSPITRIRRDDLGSGAVIEEPLPAPFLPSFDPILVLDRPTDPRWMLVRARRPAGVHVIADPAGESPRYLGRVVEGRVSDGGYDYHPGTGRLVAVDTLSGGTARPRLVVLD